MYGLRDPDAGPAGGHPPRPLRPRRYRDRGPYDRGFDVAHTTVHTGVIRGGTALNIVPAECVFDFEFRNLPGDDPHAMYAEFKNYIDTAIEPEMRAVDPACGFSIVPLSAMPALDNAPEAEIVGLAQELSGSHGFGKVSMWINDSHSSPLLNIINNHIFKEC